MSLSSVGAHSAANMSQMLVSLLNKLDTSATGTDSSTTDDTSATAIAPDTAKMQGSAKPSISSMILGTLLAMQQDTSGGSTQAGDGTDPVQSLFSSFDTDGDGTVSQSEMETSITALGGTSAQADSLFSALGGSDSEGLSESDFAAAAPPPPPDGPRHGPPPGGEDGMTARRAQNAYLSALSTLGGSDQTSSTTSSV